jgi:signal transduction histidine kinase
MKKVALVFVIAVFLPSLVLAWLAVRSLRDQQLILEHQQSLLYQGVTESLAKQVESTITDHQHDFGRHVEEMLAQTTAAKVAVSFDERLRTNWPLASVGFVVTSGGQLLAPSKSGRLEAENFVLDNGQFFSNRISAEVYWNPTTNYFNNINNNVEPASDSLSLNKQQAASVPNSWDGNNSSANNSSYNFGNSYKQKAPSARNVIVQSPEIVRTKDQHESNASRQQQQLQQQQSSKLFVAEAEFQQLIGDASEGTLARFINNKLSLLVWYRSPRDPHYIFGAQLNLNRIRDELRDWLPGTQPDLHNEICLAVLDDAARPAALSHPDFKTLWKRPFVATEIGEVLPHWELAAYLLNPDRLTQSARTLKVTLGLVIAILVAAIAIGSWLIVMDLNRQLALARQKTDFVSNVSHELKTPLTSIRMFSELLADGRVHDPAKQRSYLNIITAETARLTRLINNVLDFSRMERGEKKYNFRDCDLIQIVRDTAESYRPHLENSGFQLECDFPPGTMPLRGDCDALAQVIVNLLSNSEKYCGTTKQIVIDVRRLDGPLPCVEARVLDRGIGVPRGSEQRIFEKFYRIHDSLSSGVQGSGLGLTLARQIARAHGGDVVYESRDGGGSCFSLRLPINDGNSLS